jgi:hypothetical protein
VKYFDWDDAKTALAPFRNLNSHEEPCPPTACREALTRPDGGHVRPGFIQGSKKRDSQFPLSGSCSASTRSAFRSFDVLQFLNDVDPFVRRDGRFPAEESSSCRILLVEKTDRLYRNIKDWVTIDELGIEVHFVKENVVLSEDSRSSEKFMHGIKVLMAKNYIDNLGEEVRKGMIEKAGPLATVAPVGYQNNLATHRIEPDPERAPIIVKLFEWYARRAATESSARWAA